MKNNLQFYDKDEVAKSLGISSAQWPFFGVLWDSGIVLAEYMAVYELQNQRILEIGCGIALPSLILGLRGADITASDIHPEAELFYVENCRLNNLEKISFSTNSWNANVNLGEFDLIIGSDILYEREQTKPLAEFIRRHLKDYAKVIIVDPNRGNQNEFHKSFFDENFSRETKKISINLKNKELQFFIHEIVKTGIK